MADGGRSIEDIGRRLVALREALGMRQGAFSALTGISQNTLSNYENGTRRPDIDKAMLIVTKTGVTLDWIYFGERAGLPGRLLAVIPEFAHRARQAG